MSALPAARDVLGKAPCPYTAIRVAIAPQGIRNLFVVDAEAAGTPAAAISGERAASTAGSISIRGNGCTSLGDCCKEEHRPCSYMTMQRARVCVTRVCGCTVAVLACDGHMSSPDVQPIQTKAFSGG